MKTHSLTVRRLTLSERFASFRLAALAGCAVASPEIIHAPRAVQCPRVWVAKKAVPAIPDPLDIPLSAEEIAALPVFQPYESAILSLDPETEAEIARESAAEIAETFARIDRELAEEQAARVAQWAVQFVSDLTPQGVDFDPAGNVRSAPVKRAQPVIVRTHNRRMSDAGFAAFASQLLANT